MIAAVRATDCHSLGCSPTASGSLAELPEVLQRLEARRVLLVASAGAVTRSDVSHLVSDLDVEIFDEFAPNPTVGQVWAGLGFRDRFAPDVIIGLGGGSAMDVAKSLRVLATGSTPAQLFPTYKSAWVPAAKLVLIPTTAGSGSEATSFATVFEGHTKYSVSSEQVLPDAAILDPELCACCPPAVASASALDALSHSIESIWSRQATVGSRSMAYGAMSLIWGELQVTPLIRDAQSRQLLMSGAHLAGHAINVSKTTAAHSFAYELTTRYQVPHGVACLLNLTWLFPFNVHALATSSNNAYAALQVISSGLQTRVEDIGGRLTEILDLHGWPTRLRDFGVQHRDITDWVNRSCHERTRAANNPANLRASEVLPFVEAVW
jgi:alcohol dehydrogenase class IV